MQHPLLPIMLLSSHFHRSLLPSTTSRFHHHHLQNNSATHQQQQCLHFSSLKHSISRFRTRKQPISLINAVFSNSSSPNLPDDESKDNSNEKRSFWGAVSLIIGTAVGPGMLGLPSATIRSGPFPSSLTIIISWVYVISSILLIAELSFAAMEEEDGEVSFTGLANNAFRPVFGAFVAAVYSCLSFSLLVACVSGIGSLIVQRFPAVNPIIAHAVLPCFVGTIIAFFPFAAIDTTNRLLCGLMLFSITALVVVGTTVGKTRILNSLTFSSWAPSSILPAIPVTVLTLGFHVITPFMCKIVGTSASDARKAILLGGSVPLLMVLSWNLVVLGLSGSNFGDPIQLLLSVTPSALPAVRGFAFAALSTSLIGYALSFPKQLQDTVELISAAVKNRDYNNCGGVKSTTGVDSCRISSIVMLVVLGFAIVISSFFKQVFSNALDFAGVYANCFLFGILPPLMAWIHRSRSYDKEEDRLLPGGNGSLLLLFVIAVILFIWH